MKTIERYVFGSFLSSFLLAFLVLSFVLTIGLLVQIVGYILDGVPMSLVGEFCLVSLPETLQWSMPLALLVSSVLVFSRMSADSEIAAMRACGINLLTILRWPAIFALLCTLLGFWINNEIVPRGHEVRRSLKSKVSVDTGLAVLEPGRSIDDFPNVKIYFARKEGNWVYDLVVQDYSTPDLVRTITAARALVTQRGQDIDFELYGMTVDPVDEKHRTMARANRMLYTMKDVVRNRAYNRRVKDLRFFELVREIRASRARLAAASGEAAGRNACRPDEARDLSDMRVELAKRFVFAMAAICFVFVGVPLGIRSQRRESSIGLAISLAVMLGYYVLVILSLSLSETPAAYPHWLIWLPVALCLGLAARLIRRHL